MKDTNTYNGDTIAESNRIKQAERWNIYKTVLFILPFLILLTIFVTVLILSFYSYFII